MTAKIRWAVVGLGHIAQVAVLPAFKNARRNSKLAALVSGDEKKLKQLARKYGVPATYTYEQYDDCLASGEVDAVYVALPNHLHAEYTVRAARHGVHVLCEKPMAVTLEECRRMIAACDEQRVKLGIAYRLHFEKANLAAAELAQSGKLGDLRFFSSVFTMQVADDNIRIEREKGGGTLYDIGIYCINAARVLFRAEPIQVVAATANSGDPRFTEVEEMTTAVMRFPGERLASFTASFGSAEASMYEVVGTEGRLRVEPAFGYTVDLKHRLTIGARTRERTYPKRDQFAPELLYFADCIANDDEPEVSGQEGLNEVRIIEAMYASARSGAWAHLDLSPEPMPDARQAIRKPPHRRKPKEIGVSSPKA